MTIEVAGNGAVDNQCRQYGNGLKMIATIMGEDGDGDEAEDDYYDEDYVEDYYVDDYEEEESQERELAASIHHFNNHKVNESIITNAAAKIKDSNNRTGGNKEDGSLSEQISHDLYTQIPKCKVEELYSNNAAYRGEGYLSIERFSIQTLKPLGKGKFSQVYCAPGPIGNRVITLKVLSKG